MGCNSSAPADAGPPRRCQRDAKDHRNHQPEPRPGPPPSGASRPGVLQRRSTPATLPASPTLSLRSADDAAERDLFSAALEADGDAHVAQLPRALELDDDLVVVAGSRSSGAPQPEPESAAVVLFGFLDHHSSPSPMTASTRFAAATPTTAPATTAINRTPPYHGARSLRGSSATDATAVLAQRTEGVLRYSPLVRIDSDANFSHGHLSLTAGSTASYSARESSQPSVETSARSLRS